MIQMTKKLMYRILACVLALAVVITTVVVITTCEKEEKDSIVIMTEELSGLFNPFYATSATDMDVVGMTQIGMLSTNDEGKSVAGDDLPTVAKAFEVKEQTVGGKTETVYTFVIKNDLKFSDGHPLTMEDVMFNIYEYLDPVYTGSSTMYSVDIRGLENYRTQQISGDSTSNQGELDAKDAAQRAQARIDALATLFLEEGQQGGSTSTSYYMTEDDMRTAISSWRVTTDYKKAVSAEALTDEQYREQLVKDYEFALETFKKEVKADYKAAKESFDLESAPYKDWSSDEYFGNDIFKFLYYEGIITPEYKKVEGKDNKEVIEGFEYKVDMKKMTTEEAAIDYVYELNIYNYLHQVLTGWGTAGTLATQYSADALSIILKGRGMIVPYIEGIQSLGHHTSVAEVTVNGQPYKVAHEHDENEVPVKADEYDVLQITVDGTDPKAIYNFSFTVAPQHYYTASEENPNGIDVDVKNHQYGVVYGDSNFQSKVIQSQQHVEVPLGAGPYEATNSANGDNPTGAQFWSSNIVYYKANEHFMFDVKTEKLRMQVISTTNALDKLVNNEVDYVTPQFTAEIAQDLKNLESKGIKQLSAWQLGYGYIGINAGKVEYVNLRRAIMSAMQTSLALNYYEAGTVKNISWPMSMESWAYPFVDGDKNKTEIQHGKTTTGETMDYLLWEGESKAIEKINSYTNTALSRDGASQSDLDVTFTIAGASITEHPTYAVFKQAAELLTECGWSVEVKADSQALTKLATGSLEVWAAAWGSTIDPDMYQVYHKNSSATSTYAWGYREIKSNTTFYSYENSLLTTLSQYIDEGRATTVDASRKNIYQKAMNIVLEMAVEMPVYQRMTLYAYNSNTIKGLPSQTEINSYSTPLEKIWELELIK